VISCGALPSAAQRVLEYSLLYFYLFTQLQAHMKHSF
jgi:hypothetical protein